MLTADAKAIRAWLHRCGDRGWVYHCEDCPHVCCALTESAARAMQARHEARCHSKAESVFAGIEFCIDASLPPDCIRIGDRVVKIKTEPRVRVMSEIIETGRRALDEADDLWEPDYTARDAMRASARSYLLARFERRL